MSKSGLGGVTIALFLAIVGAGCGAKTSLPVGFDDETRPQSRPAPGGTISLTDPSGETAEYDIWGERIECTALDGDAYRIHYAVNDVVVTVQFLPYDGPGEYTSDNVRVQGDVDRLPECVGPCAEVDFRDNYTVVASSSNARCVVTADVDGAFVHVELECEGTPGSNGDGYATSGTIDCRLITDA